MEEGLKRFVDWYLKTYNVEENQKEYGK